MKPVALFDRERRSSQDASTPTHISGQGISSHKITDYIVRNHATRELVPLVLSGRSITTDFTWDYGSVSILGRNGDVVCNAVANAILGAMGSRAIDTGGEGHDAQLRSSEEELVLALSSAKRRGYVACSAHVNIIAVRPDLSDHLEGIRESLSFILDTPKEFVGVHSTGAHGLPIIASSDSISAIAIVTLQRIARGREKNVGDREHVMPIIGRLWHADK